MYDRRHYRPICVTLCLQFSVGRWCMDQPVCAGATAYKVYLLSDFSCVRQYVWDAFLVHLLYESHIRPMPTKAPPPAAACALLHGEAAASRILLQAPPCVSDRPRAMRQGARTISAPPDPRHILCGPLASSRRTRSHQADLSSAWARLLQSRLRT